MSKVCIGYDSLTINSFFSACETNARVILFGTGTFCDNEIDSIDNTPFNIVGICDSNINKQGTLYHGRSVLSPKELSTVKYDYILISSPKYYNEIYLYLTNELHIDKERILPLLSGRDISFHLLNTNLRKTQAFKKTAFIFCAPDYGNLGDHAIIDAEYRFINEKIKCDIVEVPYGIYTEALPKIKKHIHKDSLLCITGGGFLGSLWFEVEEQVRNVIEEFPDNPILMFPQTMYWENGKNWEREKENTRVIYERHKNLTLCARDKVTYGLMQEAYLNCKIILAPDMVLSCDWSEFYDYAAQRNGALLCLKTDKESILTETDKQHIEHIAEKFCIRVDIGNTNNDYPVTELTRNAELRKILSKFRSSELVITDRLHGMLFSVVTGTPCVVIDNCNHKLRSNFEWVKNISNIKFANSIDDIECKARQVMKTGAVDYNYKSFQPLYDELTKILLSCSLKTK